MSEPRNGYRAWQEGGPNETKHGGPWFVTVPDGGDIEIGYNANGLPDEYHAKLFAAAEALVKALEDAIPLLETLHSLTPNGEARRFAFSKIKNARQALDDVGGSE